jgi:hypothetical protein
VTKRQLEEIELDFGSEFPTHRNPERAALVAREAAKAHGARTSVNRFERVEDVRSVQAAKMASVGAEEGERASSEAEPWCDSEAPTGVAAERPLLPRPPRSPRV